MSRFRTLTMNLPRGAVPANPPADIRLQIVTSTAAAPEGDGWLHEIKHDGHRLISVISAGKLTLMSRNGYDRTALFKAPLGPLAASGHALVIDGEIAEPNERDTPAP